MIRTAPSVQPRSPHHSPFDLKKIDTPEEAMLMPGGDLWVGLVLGPLAGRVTISSGNEELQYETIPSPHKLTYHGALNGEPFKLEGKPANPRGIHVRGETTGGAIDSLRRGGRGGFGLDGSAGSVEFSQVLALDMSGSKENLAYLGGTVGGERLEARARKGEHGTVEVRGTLGDKPLSQTIWQGPDQEWIIRGQVGEHRYTEVIERL